MKNKEHLNVVLDTNVLLVSISEYSKYHWLYRCVTEKKIHLHITNEILAEYEEIIGAKLSPETAIGVIRALMELDNVHPTIIYFKFNLIVHDPDDNKFVDCAFSSNCDYLVTNDKHFDLLKTIDFPQLNIINLEKFREIMEENID